ncbi:MAG: hypothetical protein EXS13_01730 [Planctomycetes bacterium]|nr:hypothetical protein [Planctomycetota bacterium]
MFSVAVLSRGSVFSVAVLSRGSVFSVAVLSLGSVFSVAVLSRGSVFSVAVLSRGSVFSVAVLSRGSVFSVAVLSRGSVFSVAVLSLGSVFSVAVLSRGSAFSRVAGRRIVPATVGSAGPSRERGLVDVDHDAEVHDSGDGAEQSADLEARIVGDECESPGEPERRKSDAGVEAFTEQVEEEVIVGTDGPELGQQQADKEGERQHARVEESLAAPPEQPVAEPWNDPGGDDADQHGDRVEGAHRTRDREVGGATGGIGCGPVGGGAVGIRGHGRSLPLHRVGRTSIHHRHP